jgi:hypothetical protein
MKKTMRRRRPIRIGGKVWGTERFTNHCERAEVIRNGGNMGEHSWPWIHQAECRAGMQRVMRKVRRAA